MFKKLFTVISISLISSLNAQNINNPESVEYDAANNRYLVSNRANPISIQSLVPGQSPTLFTSGVSSPAGLEILNGQLWVCDGGSIKSFDLSNGTLVNTINVGGTFLNGITSDGSQFLFVSDFNANKIYRINTVSLNYNVMVANTGTQPNGMWFDGANNRLIYVSWGPSAPIKAVSLADSTVSTIVTTSLGSLDGIARDGSGRYYVSSWSQSGIYRFDSDFTNQQQVLSGVSQGADIFYNTLNDTLAIPRTSGDVVTFHYFGNASIGELDDNLSVNIYPNPTTDILFIETPFSEGIENLKMELVNSSGQVVLSRLSKTTAFSDGIIKLDIRAVNSGNYMLRISGAFGTLTRPISISR